MTRFDQLSLSETALEAIRSLGFTEPTPIQEQAIPAALIGRDVIACAKTGTGKTLAFALPAIDLTASTDGAQGSPRLLILTPTRELASQVDDVCSAIAHHYGLRCDCIVGGVDEAPQIEALRAGTDLLIGTPGRIIDLHSQGFLDLDRISTLVLDEADLMLDMGFFPQVKQIIDACPEDRQTLLFSATIDRHADRRLSGLLRSPVRIEADRKGESSARIRQLAIEVDHRSKPGLLKSLLEEHPHEQTIIFARTKRRVDSCLDHLLSWGYRAISIHSGKSQAQRRKALGDFSAGSAGILVATDVVARGIDLEAIDCVVNYDIPMQPEDYIHRIGRTGRAGAKGVAFTFITPENTRELKAIESLMGKPIERMQLKAFDSKENERALASKATRRNARKDPELAAAAKEYEARLKKARQKRESRNGKDGPSQSGSKKRNVARSVSKQKGTKPVRQNDAKHSPRQHPQKRKGRTGRGRR